MSRNSINLKYWLLDCICILAVLALEEIIFEKAYTKESLYYFAIHKMSSGTSFSQKKKEKKNKKKELK